MTCHVYSVGLCMSQDFRLRLKKKYAHRKLFLCGSYHFIKEKGKNHELTYLMVQRNMDCMSLWMPD